MSRPRRLPAEQRRALDGAPRLQPAWPTGRAHLAGRRTNHRYWTSPPSARADEEAVVGRARWAHAQVPRVSPTPPPWASAQLDRRAVGSRQRYAMPEVAGLLTGREGAHFSVPSLVIESVQIVCLLEFRAGFDSTSTNNISARLFDLAACLDWIERERAQATPPGLHEQHMRGRLLGAMVSHSLACLRTLWDVIPPLLDRHVASRTGRMPTTSFRKLVGWLDAKGKGTAAIPPEVAHVLVQDLEAFYFVRRLRDGIIHRGFQAFCTFSEGVPRVHFADRLTDVIAGKSRVEGEMWWYDARDILRKLLLSWLACWHRLRPCFQLRLEQVEVPPRAPRVWAFGDPAMIRLAELVGCGGADVGWWFLWPCGALCRGAVAGCPNKAGTPPAEIAQRAG